MIKEKPVKYKDIVLWALILLAPLVTVCVVYAYSFNLPYWDGWALVTILEKCDSGTLSFSDFWNLHNEHRPMFPRLVMLAIACGTDWDVRYQCYASIAVAAVTLFLLYSILRRNSEGRTPLWLMAVFSVLVFSLAQWENWTWGWTIQIFMSVCCTVAAVWAFCRWDRRFTGVVLGSVFATVAGYSFVNGLLTWVVLMIMAVQQRRPRKQIAVLVGVFVVVTAFYFYGYRTPPHHPSLFGFLRHPCDFVRYVLAYIGSPLSLRKSPTVIMGLFFVSATVTMLLRIRRHSGDEFNRLSPWIALALYSFLSACVTGVGRSAFGVDQAITSRYTTISSLFVISAIVIATSYVRTCRRTTGVLSPRWVRCVNIVVVLLSLAYAAVSFNGIRQTARRNKTLQKGALCVQNIEDATDECLNLLYPYPAILREKVVVVRDLKLSLFAD
jgi:hypothetical protein